MKRTLFLVFSVLILTSITTAQDADVIEAGYLPYWGSLGNVVLKDSVAIVTSDYGLMTFDISDPTEPTMLDHVPVRESWYPTEISLSGDIVCLQDILWHQLGPPLLFDISNPSNIEPLTELPLRDYIRSCVIYESYLYVIDGGHHLYVWDITNPDEPEAIDTVETYPNELQIFDDMLVAGFFGYSDPNYNRLEFFSLENPEHPELLGRYTNNRETRVYPESKQQFINDQYFRILEREHRPLALECIDLSDPSEPYSRWTIEFERHSIILGEINGYLAIQIDTEGEGGQLRLYSNEDPDTLIEVAVLNTPTWGYDVYSEGDLLFFSRTSGLYCMDISDLEHPEELGSFNVERGPGGNAAKIDDYLLVPMWDKTIQLISVANPENPHEVSSLRFENGIRDVYKWDHPSGTTYIAALEHPNKLIFLDMEGEDLRIISEIELDIEQDTLETYLAEFTICSWDNGLIITANEHEYDWHTVAGHLWVVSLNDPDNPAIIGYLSERMERRTYYSVFGSSNAVYRNYVYSADWAFTDGSYIISIADPENPEIISHEQDDPLEAPLAIEGNLLFAGSYIYDISDPVNPDLLSRLGANILINCRVQHGLLSRVTWDSPQFRVYNARNPEEPEFIAGVDIFDYPYDLIMEDGFFYVVERSGIQILQYTGDDHVQSDGFGRADEFTLSEPYPNPFNSSTIIKYELASAVDMSLRIYDLAGRLVETLHEGYTAGGLYTAIWNGDNRPSGLYVCRLIVGGHAVSKKMVMLR